MAQKVTPNVAIVARAFWDAAGSGSFFTRWTVIISFVVSTVLFVPIIGTSTSAYGTGFVVAVITWVMLALPVTGVAVAERRMSNRGARAIVVIATLLAIALSRPFLNDAVLDRLFGETGEGSLVTRMVTNVSVGFVLFGLVAMIVGARRRTRARTERLTVALDRWQAAMNAVDPIEGDGARLIASAAERLHAERDALLAGDIDFEAVRAFSESVRNASHVMEQASTAAPSPTPWSSTPSKITERRATRRPRVEATPWLWVGGVYGAMAAPFVLSATGDLRIVAAAFVALVVIDLLANTVLHRLRPRSERGRTVAFAIVWLVAGVVATVCARLLLPGQGLAVVVPAFALPLSAAFISFAIDAARIDREEEERFTRELAKSAVVLAEASERAAARLRAAAAILHGGVQGRCVIFAALADDHPPTDAEISRFRAETDASLANLGACVVEAPQARAGGFARMLAGWQSLMGLDTYLAESAASLIADSDDGSLLTQVVNEALVNAVKHSGARTARIEVSADRRGELFVRVASPGRLPQPIVRTRSFTGRTLLFQDGPDVVLESMLPADLALHARNDYLRRTAPHPL